MRCPRALSKPSVWGHLARWEGQLICFPFSMIGHNVWPPNIHSRPLELYPLYKCRAGHLVFSKVAVSRGVARHNRHYMALAEHIGGRTHRQQNTTVGRTQLLAEHGCWQNMAVGRTWLSAEHNCRQNKIVGRTQLSAEHYCRQNMAVGTTPLSAEHTVGRTHCWQNTLLAEHTVGRTQQWQHVIGNLPSA